MTFEEIQNIILKDGWFLDSIVGSHFHYKHPTKKGKVTIPRHRQPRDLPKKTISSILKQAQIRR